MRHDPSIFASISFAIVRKKQKAAEGDLSKRLIIRSPCWGRFTTDY